MNLLRAFHTVRYLKAAQVKGQLRQRLRGFYECPERLMKMGIAEAERCCWDSSVGFVAPGKQANSAVALQDGRFRFLNVEQRLGWPPSDWNDPGEAKLWQYNLHYFEWLWPLDYALVRQAILDWVDRCTPAHCATAWEPYAVSLRLMNWCAICFGRFRAEVERDEDFRDALWKSVWQQAEWLSSHLETHLLGNHFLENGAALAFVGSCFSGESGRIWLERGVRILQSQLPEQILPDGMHFERSPMYHVRMSYVLRLLRDTQNGVLKGLVESRLSIMENALALLCHPDGEIALFNDSAFGIYNAPGDLLSSWAKPGPWSLPAAGYYGHRGDDGSYVICDAGDIGPDYIPGHAHGDTFSFELSLNGRRVVVDSGVYDYEPGAMRDYCRSTRAHNTVEVGGQDQSEFWGSFRVARRARVHDVRWEPRRNGFKLSGWHDGYQRFAHKAIHKRTFEWTALGHLVIEDRITAGDAAPICSRLHLHPDCRVIDLSGQQALIDVGGARILFMFEGKGRVSLADSYYCPEFGIRTANVCLCYGDTGRDMLFRCTISPVSQKLEPDL